LAKEEPNMIRTSDLVPAAAWALSTRSAGRADAANAASWFDGDASGVDTRISGDLNLASRGLSVEQHAERVLMHLRGERDDPA
jgi:hypothetical protein